MAKQRKGPFSYGSRRADYVRGKANERAKKLTGKPLGPHYNPEYSTVRLESEYTPNLDYSASTRYDELLGRDSMPKPGSYMRSVNKYNMFTPKIPTPYDEIMSRYDENGILKKEFRRKK